MKQRKKTLEAEIAESERDKGELMLASVFCSGYDLSTFIMQKHRLLSKQVVIQKYKK